jgi:SAM-dependent methyltransferase
MTEHTSDPTQDDVNRAIWVKFADAFVTEGWGDPSELGALLSVADRVRSKPILDLGVGAGRTLSLLRLLSDDYVGIDYTPRLVELCLERHPAADVRVGDARDLSSIEPASITLVCFSSNGIDAVDHEDRQVVLDEVHRVLRPGGLFVFSTLNKGGAFYGCHPGSVPELSWVPGSLLPRPQETTPVEPQSKDDEEPWLRAVKNWRRLRGSSVDHESWGIAPFAAHEFGVLTHFITLPGEIAELDEHGFDVEAVFECDRFSEMKPGQQTAALYTHLIAVRRS